MLISNKLYQLPKWYDQKTPWQSGIFLWLSPWLLESPCFRTLPSVAAEWSINNAASNPFQGGTVMNQWIDTRFSDDYSIVVCMYVYIYILYVY